MRAEEQLKLAYTTVAELKEQNVKLVDAIAALQQQELLRPHAGNIGSEESARHNAFMFSVIESCKMNKRTVEDYLMSLLDKLRLSREGDD